MKCNELRPHFQKAGRALEEKQSIIFHTLQKGTRICGAVATATDLKRCRSAHNQAPSSFRCIRTPEAMPHEDQGPCPRFRSPTYSRFRDMSGSLGSAFLLNEELMGTTLCLYIFCAFVIFCVSRRSLFSPKLCQAISSKTQLGTWHQSSLDAIEWVERPPSAACRSGRAVRRPPRLDVSRALSRQNHKMAW